MPQTNLDKTQFEKLFKLHFQHLCNFADQYVEDIHAAQDICQKVFIQLWEKRGTIDWNKSVKSYLFTSVKNRCLNYIRDNKRYRSQILDIECADFEFAEEDLFFDQESLEEKIEAALVALPEKCRQVFELSRFHDMKYKEISEQLQISQKTVEAHMSKALKTLRHFLQDFITILSVILFIPH